MFERGFKTWCEKYAVNARQELGLVGAAPIDPRALAKQLGLRVWTPHDVPGLSEETLAVLLRNDGKTPSCWSAVTLVVENKAVVILNSSHSAARQSSDLAHELAHRILGHKAREVNVTEDGLMLLSEYDKSEEDEADWLSGCLLLPREALVSIRRRGLNDINAATEYGVSLQMLGWRIARTGIQKQFA
jgi:Zn-dependent peptidase ImmA (M78 family)